MSPAGIEVMGRSLRGINERWFPADETLRESAHCADSHQCDDKARGTLVASDGLAPNCETTMATLIPTLGSAQFDSRGELRLAERLKDLVEDNAWIWHNIPVGPKGRHPDFVLLHPTSGLLVLEVKDWRLDSILRINRLSATLLSAQGQSIEAQNPLEQARRYMFDIKREIERDCALLFASNTRFKGRPIVPMGFGAVFPNITRKQFESTDLREALSPDRCLFRDEMSESAHSEAFRSRLWAMVSPRLGPSLTMPQFDHLRALIFPEIRVRQIALPLESADESQRGNGLLAAMDLNQEQVARSLGEGHRIIRGVAGSGKTLILAFRAEYLSRAATKPILILCYANGIAGRLESAMQDRGIEERIQVSTFHSWCLRILRTYDIKGPTESQFPNFADRLRATVDAVVHAVESGLIPGGQYDAVLIDEAHDFEPQWLSLAAKMVSPDKRALMIVYDDMQAIYKGRTRPVWKQLGIEAKGRTTVLKVNYRNTAQILGFARRFAADVFEKPGVPADDESAILLPEDGGRQGEDPIVRQCVSPQAEAHAIAEWLLSRRAIGYEWPEMAVLYPEHRLGATFGAVLSKHGIPLDIARDNRNRITPRIKAVRMLSMHTAKGLEFPCVAVGGLGSLGQNGPALEDDVRLTYVAVTRATHHAFLTYSSKSALVVRLVQ